MAFDEARPTPSPRGPRPAGRRSTPPPRPSDVLRDDSTIDRVAM